LGAPPRDGFVTTDGEVVVWRDGAPILLARIPAGRGATTANRTADGIVVTHDTHGVLHIGLDGRVDRLWETAGRVLVSEDGRHLVVLEARYGRRSRNWLHVVDIADGTRETMPWDDKRMIFLTPFQGGVVHFEATDVEPTAPMVRMRWSPGRSPEPADVTAQQIDPVSGAAVVPDDAGVNVVRADGTSIHLPIAQFARLTPGGRWLYTFQEIPPAIALFDAFSPVEDARVIALPDGTNLVGHRPPVWEDVDTLVALVWGYGRVSPPAVRLDVVTGKLERVPVAGNTAQLVRPLLR
jgi:hypothetical protein